MLAEHAAELGFVVRRGYDLTGLSQDADTVTAEVAGPDGRHEFSATGTYTLTAETSWIVTLGNRRSRSNR